MEEFNNKIFEAALNGEKIDVIAYTYDISKSKVLKLLNTLEDKNNPNYNPNLAYNILI